MDGNRRDSGCRPFFAHAVIRNLSGGRRVLTDVFEKYPTLHARDDLHDEKKQGRAAVGK